MASLAAAAPKPIKALFAEAEALLRKVEDGHDAEDATTCVSLLDDAWAARRPLDLFPAGCTGDDVATADLRYALIPDLRARARSRVRTTDGPAGRLALVERCRKDRARFLELAAALDPEVAERDDDDTDDGAARAPSALDVRRKAIERHEAKKRSAEALAEAQRALKDAQTPEERDELERDVIIAELRSHAATCEEAITSDDRELDLLRRMASNAPPQRVRPPQNADAAWLLGARPGGQNGGLRVLRMDRDDAGTVRARRETVRSGVFRPSHRLPTMTIEEFADLEIADAQERSEREKAAAARTNRPSKKTRPPRPARGGVRRGGHGARDHARARSEAWANWLEEHPRGAGNKGGSQLCCCLPACCCLFLVVRCFAFTAEVAAVADSSFPVFCALVPLT